MVMSALNGDFVQCYASVWQAHMELIHISIHIPMWVLIWITCVYVSYKHVLPIHQPGLDAESGDWSPNDLSFTKYPQSQALSSFFRRSNLNLGWWEILFFTAWCFHWFVKKRKSFPGPLSSSWLKTHLDCSYPNRCRTMQQRSDAAFAAMIHCCSQAERQWQWVRALFLS